MSRNQQPLKNQQLLPPADAKLIDYVRHEMLIILSDCLTRKLLAIRMLVVLGRDFDFLG